MKLLVVYPYIPYPADRGAYHRALQLLRALAGEHEVHLCALAERREGMAYRSILESICARVEIVPFEHPAWQKLIPTRILNPMPATVAHWKLEPAARAIGSMLGNERYDAAHVFDIVLAQYFLNQNRQMPLVVDRTRVDLQYQWMEYRRMSRSLKTSILHFENVAKLWQYERAVAKRSRFHVVCGPDDERFVKRYVRRDLPMLVLPNGVDLDYFDPKQVTEQRAAEPAVLFCGAMDYNPNIDALRWYFSAMHKELKGRIPNLKVWVVGRDPVPEVLKYGQEEGVTVTGGVPDVRPFYRRAWVQIVPLRIGGGTRLKIVESMAMGTPVISTSIGAQGLGLEHGNDVLFGDTAKDFVRETAKALEDRSLRWELETNGRETAKERLSWNGLGRRLNQFYAAQFGVGTEGERGALEAGRTKEAEAEAGV